MTRARDIANNWAADITAVSAGIGITGGGTSGAVTVTNQMATTIDAKGDLVVGTGADTYTRVAVGSNNEVLTADSATTSGLKWATAVASVSGTAGRITVTGTGTPTIDLATSGVTAGTYGSSTTIPQLAVDTYGRITSISNAGLTASSAMTFVGTQTATNGGITFSSIPTHKSLRMYVSQVNTSGNSNITQMRVNGISTSTYVSIQNTYISGTAPYAQYQNPAGGAIWSQQDGAWSIGSVQNGMGNIHYIIDFPNSGFSTALKWATVFTHAQGNTASAFPTQAYLLQNTGSLTITSISFGTNWTGTGSIRADLFAIA